MIRRENSEMSFWKKIFTLPDILLLLDLPSKKLFVNHDCRKYLINLQFFYFFCE